MIILDMLRIGKQRWITHIALGLLCAAGAYAGHLYAPYADANYVFTIGFGYTALILIAVSLMVGPFKLLSQRRNPVNIDLRRDMGIWSAITGCLHVFFGLQLHERGQIILYFLEPTPHGYRLLRNLFGLSNDVGALATILLVVLLVISNDLSLRRLKGKRWKLLQRGNYLLAAFALAHTFGYQTVSRREHIFTDGVILLTLATLVIQLAGVYLYRSRRARLMRIPKKA
ncbi:MAG: ferric reductase-like transmembrane domain-containing protein [Chloroflexota bacterium]